MHVRWGGVCSEPELKSRAHKQASKRPALPQPGQQSGRAP